MAERRSPLLRVADLVVTLAGTRVLDGVSLDVGPAEVVGVVGESGAGKTMFVRALSGTLERIGAETVSGSIVLDGKELIAATEADWSVLRGRVMSVVPQAAQSSLDPLMRVGAQIEETVACLDPGRDRKARAAELVERVRLPSRVLVAYPHELSGGMKQRVMVALALVGGPRLVLADEPTTALDVTVQREVLDLLETLRRDDGMSLILISHDLEVVRDRCEAVCVMYGGMAVEIGPTERVLRDPAHPYTRALVSAAPLSRTDPHAKLRTVGFSPERNGPSRVGCPYAERCAFAEARCSAIVPRLHTIEPEHDAACLRLEDGSLDK